MTTEMSPARAPERDAGYAPIRDYGAIGDGRTAALVAFDGSIDWLCVPTFDCPSVFAALLDPARGGRFELAPSAPFECERRYLPDTNVLETVFTTDAGAVRVTDAMTLRDGAPPPWSEIARRIECLSGEVRMRWRVEPRFEFGERAQITMRGGVPVATAGANAMVVMSWDAGQANVDRGGVGAELIIRQGQRALLACAVVHDSPRPFPRREEVEHRLDSTIEHWPRFASRCRYEGPWRDAVSRSVLALRLLQWSSSGAVAAAPTTSLPERVGASRNFDYRFCWVRDTSFMVHALLATGYREEAHAAFAWLLGASRHTHPRLQPVYKLDGRPPKGQVELGLRGYRGSTPVRAGNEAGQQLQLGNYADMLDVAYMYVEDGASLDEDTGLRLAQVADLLLSIWRSPDAGIWELGDRQDYTQSKMACWVAFDRARKLAEAGQLPGDRAGEWLQAARDARTFVDERCWSSERATFVRHPASQDLDAAVLLAARMGFLAGDDPRLASTVDAICEELGRGPFLYRYSGMHEEEGAFLACSFWLVEALALCGRLDDAERLMDELVALANDLGLYSEEIDPQSRELLGNFPQGLTHLAVINAAVAVKRGRHRANEAVF